MKKLTFLFILITSLSFSQYKYENGYYIDNNDTKINCLIKNFDWKFNPNSISIKLNEDSETVVLKVEDIKEFSVLNSWKFIREKVMIDETTNNFQTLQRDPNPVFAEKVLLLKVLVEGKSNLYHYENDNYERFFYSINGKIEQLVYKNYINENKNMVTNESYKQQLFVNFKCNNDQSKILKLNYRENSLTDYFIETNNCISGTNNVEKKKIIKKSKSKSLFSVFTQGNFLNADYVINNSNIRGKYLTNNKVNFSGGLEYEILMPYGNYSWSFVMSANFVSYKDVFNFNDELDVNKTYEIDTKVSIVRFPIGMRKYFSINDFQKLFVNVDCNYNFVTQKIKIANENFDSKNVNFSLDIGAGYKYKKFFTELKYYLPKKTDSESFTNEFNLNHLALKLGYQIF